MSCKPILLFLRVELLRGKLDAGGYREAVAAAREDLMQQANSAGSENFLLDFLQRWKSSENSGRATLLLNLRIYFFDCTARFLLAAFYKISYNLDGARQIRLRHDHMIALKRRDRDRVDIGLGQGGCDCDTDLPATRESLTSKVIAFNGPLTSYFSNMFCMRSHFRRGTIIVINSGS